MNIYVDNGAVVIAGKDLTMRIESADLTMIEFEQYEFEHHGKTPTRVIPTYAFSAGLFDGRIPNLSIPNINYEVGKEYTVEQLLNQPPPDGTVIINELSHVLQYRFDDWHYGTQQIDLSFLDKSVEFKVIHIP